MIKANVATAKNELSRLLRRVKRGERVIITERNHPIAQIQPYTASDTDSPETALTALYEAGVLTAPVTPRLDVAGFLALPRGAPIAGQSLTVAILAEREEGR